MKKLASFFGPKTWLAILAVLVLAGGYWWWSSTRAPKVTYMTEIVKRGSIRKVVEATGEIQAVNLVTVGAQVSGQIKKLYVVLGQQVKQGEMIAEIDSQTQENLLNIDRTKLANYKTQLAARQAILKLAKKEYDRERALYKKNATSQLTLDKASDAYETAKANVAELQALVKQTQIAINTDETNLGYTQIRSPLNGTIVSIPVEEGQTVNANQTTPTIVQIANLNDMEIQIEISEGDITKVEPGMDVEYTILSEPGMSFKTTLAKIDPGLTTLSDGSYNKGSGSSSSSSGSASAVYYYGRAYVDNPEGRLRIGMMTQNTINVASVEDVLIVPSITVKEENGKKYVQVVSKDKKSVESREVQTGLSDGVNTEIVSGLSEGEEVVSSTVNEGEQVGSTSKMRRMRL